MNTETQDVCGACGQFFPTNEADSEGFHSSDYCSEGYEAEGETCLICYSDKDSNELVVCSTCNEEAKA